MRMKFFNNAMLRDYLAAFFSEVMLFLSFFLVYKIIAKKFSIDGVAEYSIIRRIQPFLGYFFLLGMEVGLLRYVPSTRNTSQKKIYLTSAFLIYICTSILVWIFLVLFQKQIVFLFWNEVNEDTYRISILLAQSYAIHFIFYSYLRARIKPLFYNLFHVMNQAIVPVILLFFVSSVFDFILFWSIYIVAVSFLLIIASIAPNFNFFYRQIMISVKTLLTYSLPRALGGILYYGIFYLGSYLGIIYHSVKKGGIIGLAVTLLATITVITNPLISILMPRISMFVREGKMEKIQSYSLYVIEICFSIGFLVAFFFFFNIESFLIFWIGPEIKDEVITFKLITPSIPFFITFLGIVGILEALRKIPFSLIILAFSGAVQVGTFWIFNLIFKNNISIPITLSYVSFSLISCLLAIYIVKKVTKIELKTLINSLLSSIYVASLSLVAIVLGSLLKLDSVFSSLIWFIIIGGVSFVLYIFMLLVYSPPWFSEILQNINFQVKFRKLLG